MVCAQEKQPSLQGSKADEAIQIPCFSCVSRNLKHPRCHGEDTRGMAAPPSAPRHDKKEYVAAVAVQNARSPSHKPSSSSRTPCPAKPKGRRWNVRDLPHYLNAKIPPFALQMFGMTRVTLSSPGFSQPPTPSSP